MTTITPAMVRCVWCPECHKVLSMHTEPVPTLVVDEDPLDGNGLPEWKCFWCGFSLRPAFWTFFMGHPEPFSMKPLPDWEAEFSVDAIEDLETTVKPGSLF